MPGALMAGDWTDEQNDAIVADYFAMLADDIAEALGGRAHLVELRRTAIGSLDVAEAVTVAELEEAGGEAARFLLPVPSGLRDLPVVRVTEETAVAVGHGSVFPAAGLGMAVPGEHAVFGPSGDLLAVYRSDGRRAVPEVVLR